MFTFHTYTIYGSCHETQMPRTNFRSPYPRRLHIKFGFDWASGVEEEVVWNCGRTDDGAWYPISSPMSVRLR